MTKIKEYLTRDNRKYTIRHPDENDAANVINYSKQLFASTNQVLNTLEEYTITVDQEKVWITNFNKNQNALLLIAELDHQVIGMIFFIPNTKRKNAHTGEFGVNVHPKFQRMGIGRKLIEMLIDWAKENSIIEKVILTVFETNHYAIKLYKSLGFKEEGRHVKAVKQLSGEYVDTLQLYLETK